MPGENLAVRLGLEVPFLPAPLELRLFRSRSLPALLLHLPLCRFTFISAPSFRFNSPMIGFVALAPLAILASSSLVDALPSPVRLEGSVPTVTPRDGTVDEALFARNLDATFQKLDGVNPGQADVEPQVGRKARRALPLGKRCDKQAQVSLDARQYAVRVSDTDRAHGSS